jgi:hypothetical protein
MKHFIKVLFIGIMLMLSGCSQKDSDNTVHNNNMLVLIEISHLPSPWINDHAILVDRETRVMYMENIGSGSGIPVVMLDPEGKPRIYKGDLY